MQPSSRLMPVLLFLALFSYKTHAHDSIEHITLHHADLAYASYQASLNATLALQEEVTAFIDSPSEANLASARSAWVAARDIYSQTETFRFGHPPVDAWEPQPDLAGK